MWAGSPRSGRGLAGPRARPPYPALHVPGWRCPAETTHARRLSTHPAMRAEAAVLCENTVGATPPTLPPPVAAGGKPEKPDQSRPNRMTRRGPAFCPALCPAFCPAACRQRPAHRSRYYFRDRHVPAQRLILIPLPINFFCRSKTALLQAARHNETGSTNFLFF